MVVGVLTMALMAVFAGKTACETNIALGKQTKQSNDWNSWTNSDRAVDGYLYGQRPGTPHPIGSCTYTTTSSQNGWWYVDLGMEYKVKDVTVHTRTDCCVDYRQKYVRLSVGPSLSELTDCTPQPYYNAGSQKQYTISCNRLGRYVHIEAWGARDKGMLGLCEVLVTASWIDCSECPPGVPCNNVTGGCSQCAAGRLPPDCATDCDDGNYGLNCSRSCGSCASGARHCAKDSGVCTQGCQLWWTTDKCDVEITPYVAGPSVKHSSGDSTSADVTGLEPYTSYDFLVTPWRRMSGQEEAGTPYPVITAKTACGFPDPPLGVSASGSSIGGFGIIVITWKDLTTLNPHCASLINVFVEFRQQAVPEWSVNVADLKATIHTMTLPGGGEYDVRVTVVNSDQLAASSDVITVDIKGELLKSTSADGIPGEYPMTTTAITDDLSGDDNLQVDGRYKVAFIAAVGSLGVLLVVGISVIVYLVINGRSAVKQNTQLKQQLKQQSGVPMTKLSDSGHVTETHQYEHTARNDVTPVIPAVYDSIRVEDIDPTTGESPESPYEQV